MIWWWRSRQPRVVLGAAVIHLVLAAALGSSTIPVPSLLASSLVSVAAAVFVPLILTAALLQARTAADSDLEPAAIRRVWFLDGALVVGMVAGLFMVGIAIREVFGSDGVLAATRNAAGYVGLALCASVLLSSTRASIVPAAYIVLVTLTTSATEQGNHLLGWPVDPARSPSSMAIAAALLLCGLVVQFRR